MSPSAPSIAKSGRATIQAKIITVPHKSKVSISAINPVPNHSIFPKRGITAPRIGIIAKNAFHPINISRSPPALRAQLRSVFSVTICANISCAVKVPREIRERVLFFAL